MVDPRTFLSAVRAAVILVLCTLPGGCMTAMLWQQALSKEGDLVHSESLELVSLTPLQSDAMLLETAKGHSPSPRFRMTFRDGARHWRQFVGAKSLGSCSLKLEMLETQGGVGEGTLVLGGELRDSARPIQDPPPFRSRGELPLESRSAIVLDGRTWWQCAHGRGHSAPEHYRPIAWLQNGVPVADDEEVWRALGNRWEAPDLVALAGYELCVEAREMYGVLPTWFAVRGDALWFGYWGTAKLSGSGDCVAWTHETTWDVKATDATPPVSARSAALPQSRPGVGIRWYASRSRVLPVLGAVVVTPVVLGLEAGMYSLFMVYVVISAPFTDWEGPF